MAAECARGVIPLEANGAFVAAMEDVLSVYTRPHDPDRPLVCLDETTKQLTKETRAPVPMKKGQPARVDYEYERNGTANMFMIFAPLEGWRHPPKHGSWLDLAESELGILASQCLDRRIPDQKTLIAEVAAWQRDCNRHHAKADWHFTT